eukprot:TRINITY_DN3090_c1_g1_i1.p1 TRINITY_DN3090_c1_g1~~TRINITY_DN3090_c1_g1_i1.p1  ORF type:complete len:830 (+),score=127.17 TRINITY_DN3090_c1_g1_i1:55-2490(+)
MDRMLFLVAFLVVVVTATDLPDCYDTVAFNSCDNFYTWFPDPARQSQACNEMCCNTASFWCSEDYHVDTKTSTGADLCLKDICPKCGHCTSRCGKFNMTKCVAGPIAKNYTEIECGIDKSCTDEQCCLDICSCMHDWEYAGEVFNGCQNTEAFGYKNIGTQWCRVHSDCNSSRLAPESYLLACDPLTDPDCVDNTQYKICNVTTPYSLLNCPPGFVASRGAKDMLTYNCNNTGPYCTLPELEAWEVCLNDPWGCCGLTADPNAVGNFIIISCYDGGWRNSVDPICFREQPETIAPTAIPTLVPTAIPTAIPETLVPNTSIPETEIPTANPTVSPTEPPVDTIEPDDVTGSPTVVPRPTDIPVVIPPSDIPDTLVPIPPTLVPIPPTGVPVPPTPLPTPIPKTPIPPTPVPTTIFSPRLGHCPSGFKLSKGFYYHATKNFNCDGLPGQCSAFPWDAYTKCMSMTTCCVVMEERDKQQYLLGSCEDDSIQLIGNGDVYSACVKEQLTSCPTGYVMTTFPDETSGTIYCNGSISTERCEITAQTMAFQTCDHTEACCAVMQIPGTGTYELRTCPSNRTVGALRSGCVRHYHPRYGNCPVGYSSQKSYFHHASKNLTSCTDAVVLHQNCTYPPLSAFDKCNEDADCCVVMEDSMFENYILGGCAVPTVQLINEGLRYSSCVKDGYDILYEFKPAPPETLWEERRTLWIILISVSGSLCCCFFFCALLRRCRNRREYRSEQWNTTYFNPIIEDEYQNSTTEMNVRCRSCGTVSPSTTGICSACDRTSVPRTATSMKLMSEQGGKHVFLKNLRTLWV